MIASNTPTTSDHQAQLRARAARVLDYGFRVAVTIIAIGLILSVVKQEALPNSLGSPGEVIRGVLKGEPGSILGLGILGIIITPVISTIVIAWTFREQGDIRYATRSGLVLIILLISIGFSLR